jgi:2-polyprenyl-3-methyl-5-hydroxy-6-metoxy-1,4-benzoquinol methylase
VPRTANNVTLNDYGWRAAQPPESNRYTTPTAIRACKKFGVCRVLDAGCGNGALCRTLAENGFDTTGCDADPRGIEIAAGAVPQARFAVVGVYDEPARLGTDKFGAVVCTEVIEHLYLPCMLPRFAPKVLRPRGLLILSTPYHGYLKNLALSVFDHWDAHYTSLWDGGHIKFWSRRTLSTLLNEEGFDVVDFHGCGRVPFLWRSMVLVCAWRGETAGVQP